MKTNNKTDNSKLFWGVFLLLLIFGIIFSSTLFLFGKSEYLILGAVAQLMILGNFFLWRYSKRWQKLLKIISWATAPSIKYSLLPKRKRVLEKIIPKISRSKKTPQKSLELSVLLFVFIFCF